MQESLKIIIPILAIVLTIYLEYTGKIELRELKKMIKQKTSN
jgi:hypothetical protein